MAVPFKNGADLYNNEVLRMRLHNLGADPTEVGAGLIYFNTSNDLNTSKKARIYTGDAWKTFAFVEDLDVASNADFIALQEKVALLAGDVDTDAIISNMKEVSAFLEGFAEDASLMDYLNTELGKKLDKTGGTIEGEGSYPLIIKSSTADYSTIRLMTSNDNFITFGYKHIAGDTIPKMFFTDKNGWNSEYLLLHSGNYSDYALPLTGGTINGNLLIGTTTDNGAKLQVSGKVNTDTGYYIDTYSALEVYSSSLYVGYQTAVNGGIKTRIWGNDIEFSNNAGQRIALFKNDKDIEIEGTLRVKGNIIADGEVSAGGAGEEGETESTGNASAWAQTFTPTNTTMPFEHNRATTDVIVQVYEKNDGGSWDMILVDVEIISETKVNLHFGRTENREHKIVIMG